MNLCKVDAFNIINKSLVMKRISFRHLFAITLVNVSLLGLSFMPMANAENQSNESIENLSDDLRVLLKQEMRAVEQGMKDIITANLAGDSKAISDIATKIKNSFILKQSLTKSQMHELHTKLSSDLIRQDKDFHYMAGMLAHAADMKKPELINFYYSKLFEACLSCHKVHAQHRFSNLTLENNNHNHNHNHSHDH